MITKLQFVDPEMLRGLEGTHESPWEGEIEVVGELQAGGVRLGRRGEWRESVRSDGWNWGYLGSGVETTWDLG